jgi:hypothetical protein
MWRQPVWPAPGRSHPVRTSACAQVAWVSERSRIPAGVLEAYHVAATGADPSHHCRDTMTLGSCWPWPVALRSQRRENRAARPAAEKEAGDGHD